MWSKTLIAVLLLLVVAGASWAGGQVEITSAPSGVSREYIDSALAEEVTVELTQEGNESAYELGITAQNSSDPLTRYLSDGAGNQLPYRITSVGGTFDLMDRPDAPSTDEIIRGSLASSESETKSFEIRLEPDLQGAAGIYTDSVFLNAYSRTVFGWNLSDSTSFGLTIVVPQRVELSLVSTGVPFDPASKDYNIDFGFLSTGDSRTMDLLVRGNTGYTVSIQSSNGGVLRHDDPIDGSTVPYLFRLDGNQTELSTGSQEIVDRTAPPTTGIDRFALAFEIGSYGNVTSGEYQDTLQLVVTAR